MVVAADVVLVTVPVVVLLAKVVGLGLGGAAVDAGLAVAVFTGAVVGLGAAAFVGVGLLAVVAGLAGDAFVVEVLAVKLDLTGAFTSPFAKGFFSKLPLVDVMGALGFGAGFAAAVFGAAVVVFAVVAVGFAVKGFALAGAGFGDAIALVVEVVVLAAGFLAAVGVLAFVVFFSAATAVAATAAAAAAVAVAATAATGTVSGSTSGSFTVSSGSEGTEGVSSFAGESTTGSANSGVIVSVSISVGRGYTHFMRGWPRTVASPGLSGDSKSAIWERSKNELTSVVATDSVSVIDLGVESGHTSGS